MFIDQGGYLRSHLVDHPHTDASITHTKVTQGTLPLASSLPYGGLHFPNGSPPCDNSSKSIVFVARSQTLLDDKESSPHYSPNFVLPHG